MQNNNINKDELQDLDAPFYTNSDDAPVINNYPISQDNLDRADRITDQTPSSSLGDIAGAAIDNQWSAAWLFNQNDNGLFDPDFRMTDDHYSDLQASGISDEFFEDFVDVQSQDHFISRKERLLESLESRQIIADSGWVGIGAEMIAAMTDPASVAAALLSGGTLNAALGATRLAKMSRLRKAALMGSTAAVEGAAIETVLVNANPTSSATDILYAALGGAALGSIFGAAARPYTATEDRGIYNAFNTARDDIHPSSTNTDSNPENIGSSGASVGAMHISSPYESISEAADDAAREAFRDGVPASALNKAYLRPDVTGQLLRSDHPEARYLGSFLAEDGVGKLAGAVNTFSVSERQTMLHNRMTVRRGKAELAGYREWGKEQGLNGLQMHGNYRRAEFDELVGLNVREEFPDVSPAVSRAITAQREFYAEYAKLAQNPASALGGNSMAVKGFENISSNPHYFPRVYDVAKFDTQLRLIGQVNAGKLFGSAMRALDHELTEEAADRIGYAHVRSIQMHHNNPVDASLRLSGGDLEGLREMLEKTRSGHELDISDSDIDYMIGQLTKKEKADVKHGNRRLLIDEKFSGMIRPSKGGLPVEVKITDFLDTNAATVGDAYSRSLSGHIALSQMGTSLKEIRAIKTRIFDSPDAYKKKDTSQRDIRNIDYLLTHILGRPEGDYGRNLFEQRNSMVGKTTRILTSYNALTGLGRVGEAQMVELANLLGSKSIKAFIQSMPRFADFMRNAHDLDVSDPLMRDFETAFGQGTDILKGNHINNVDDLGALDNKMGVEAVLEFSKQTLFNVSGMNIINTFLQKAAMRTIAQRFANVATGTKLSKVFADKDLAGMGLSKEDAEAIFEQINKHASFKDSLLGQRLYELKWDKWDADVRAKMTNAIFRDSRRAIQQNDVGTAHPFQATNLGKMLFQFRSFMISAHSKQFLNAIHRKDFDTFSKVAIMTLMGSAMYVAQTHMRAISKEDPQEYIDKRLKGLDGDEPWRVLSGGFSKTGYSSFVPMITDGILNFLHQDPIFDARSSGLSSSGLLSNPTINLVNNALKASSGVASAATSEDYSFSKVDARALKGIIPFQNAYGVNEFLNWAMEDLPERSSGE